MSNNDDDDHPSNDPNATATTYFCGWCGRVDSNLLRCSGCRETYYCSKDHQIQHYKQSHKNICRYIRTFDRTSLWIEVLKGEGSGLYNTMIHHLFSTKQDGLGFVQQQQEFANGKTSRPLRSPYCEFLGWDIEMYCSLEGNTVHLPDEGLVDVNGNLGTQGLNGAAIYLGCDIQTGISRYIDVDGRVFVTGRNQTNGKSLTSDILWGILSFIYDSMSLYGLEGGADTNTLAQWAIQYKQGIWQPKGTNDGNINVYCLDVYECRNAVGFHNHIVPPAELDSAAATT